MVKVGINGFGRIGRMILRAWYESQRQDISIVAINDLASRESQAHLLSYDSIHGRFSGCVKVADEGIVIDDHLPIRGFSEPDPARIPWGDLGVQIVLECSGRFTKYEDASQHLRSGVQHVLVSAPGTKMERTVVFGVNHHDILATDKVISNASCTTNCLAPVVLSLHRALGIERGYMTTIHSYTGDQRLIDTDHKDLHRARAATLSMIPTSTGAALAVGEVIPELRGKIDGMAIRVPTPNVSVVDFTFTSSRVLSVACINEVLANASYGILKNVLAVTDLPLVSVDFNHDPHSAIVDMRQTQVVDEKMGRVLAWYDNEWGFSNRMLDVAAYWGQIT